MLSFCRGKSGYYLTGHEIQFSIYPYSTYEHSEA